MIEVVDTLYTFASNEAPAQPSEQVFVLSSSQLQAITEKAVVKATEPLQARILKLEENSTILYDLISKNERNGPTTIERANKIKEIMSKRTSISFAELRGSLNCKKDSLKRAIKLFLEENEGYGIIEGLDKRSSLLVKFRRN